MYIPTLLTLSFLATAARSAAAGLYGQGPAILDRNAHADQSVPLNCRRSPAILVFGDIRNFAAATSFCSSYIVSATTTTLLKTIAHPLHTTPCSSSSSATPTAGRLSNTSKHYAKVRLEDAPGGAATRKPADVSAACSCLIERPERVTVTVVRETYVHAPVATGRGVVVQQAERGGRGFADWQRQFLA